ncbi:unnamed protein product [Polarella glacialis]|uniref:TOG domain-containing protein n=1 Tax=Polarella glacialis TaxID=89957 RepID=A0A813HD53_POLGL|nr:unnamed protein product [Polarella glacialis]
MCAMHAKSARRLALFCAAAAVALIFGLLAGDVVQPTYPVGRRLQHQSILLHPTTAPQVPQHMNSEPHQSKLPALLPSVVPGIRLCSCTVMIHGLCVLPCVKFPPMAVGHPWPTVTELKATPSDFQGRGTAFMIVALALVTLACAAVEIVGLTFRCRAKKVGGGNGPSEYQRILPVAEGNNDQPITSTEHEARGVTVKTHSQLDDIALDATRQRNFASYFTFYHCGMWCGCYWAYLNGFLGATGLSYEIYLAWMSAMAVIHMICLVKSICADRLVPEQWECSKKLVMSLTPILSEPLDGLRDPVMAALYVTSGYAGRIPALLVMIGVILPFFYILQDQAPFDCMQEAYWPLYGKVKAQLRTNTPQAGEPGDEGTPVDWVQRMLEKACEKALVFSKQQTDPLKHILVLYEDVPQLCAAVVFAVLGGSSVLSAAIGSVAFLKLLAIKFARKYILSFTAKWNIPWRGISSDDLQQACACEVVSWDIRARAVLDLLANSNPPTNVERTGLETLHELYNRYAADDEAKAAKVATDATRLLVGMLHGRSAQEAQKTLEALYGGYKHFSFIASAVQSFLDRKPEDATLADFVPKIQVFGRRGSPAAPFAAEVAALLKDRDESVRLAAVEALAAFGPEAATPFATDVAALLKDKDEIVRKAVLKALASLGPEAKLSIATDVAAMLKDEDGHVRRTVVKALAALGPEAKLSIATDVVALLKDQDENIRLAAVEAFVSLGPELVAPFAANVAALLKDEVWYLRQAAVEALAAFGPEAATPFATDVAALLKDEHVLVRKTAVEALAAFGPELGAPFATDVAAMLKDKNGQVKQAAVEALASLGIEAKLSIATDVAALLKTQDGQVRQAAVKALAALGLGVAAPFAANVAALLKDQDENIRLAAVEAFASLGPGVADPFATDVAALLKDEDEHVRRAAVKALAALGPEAAAPFVAYVVALLKDKDGQRRQVAVEALASLGPQAIAPIANDMAALLKDKVGNVRQAAVTALASLGPELRAPFATDVAALLQDKRGRVRLAAVEALASLGPEAIALIANDMAALLKDEVGNVRKTAVTALASLGPELGAPFATDVAALLQDREEYVRQAAVKAFAALGPELGAPFATDVAALLQDRVGNVRLAAVEALASLGPGVAAPFATGVAALLKDEDEHVRRAAVEALAALGPGVAAPFATDVADLIILGVEV